MSPTRKPSTKHSNALDGVRGLAILLVLGVHLEFVGALTGTSRPVSLIRKLMYTGWIGVDLFFVLSGFLITGILLDTKDSPNRLSSFYARRALRIFPLYYFMIGLMIFLSLRFQPLGQHSPSPDGMAVLHRLSTKLVHASSRASPRYFGPFLESGRRRAVLPCLACNCVDDQPKATGLDLCWRLRLRASLKDHFECPISFPCNIYEHFHACRHSSVWRVLRDRRART